MNYLFSLLFTLMALGASAQTAYSVRDSLFSDDTFRGRVRIAMTEAASEVLANPADSLKFDFAGRVLLEPASEYFTDMFTAAVLTNPVISGSSSDSDIKFTVNTQFTKLATEYRRQRNEGEFAPVTENQGGE